VLARKLDGEVQKARAGAAFRDFLLFLRSEFLAANLGAYERHLLELCDVTIPTMPGNSRTDIAAFERIKEAKSISWADQSFHLKYRIHLNCSAPLEDFAFLSELLPETREAEPALRDLVLNGVEVHDNNGTSERRCYDLSILPLNLLLDESVIRCFIPPADYLKPHPTKKADPYGIITGKSRARIGGGKPAVIADGRTKLVLGAHKFSNTLLFDVDFCCPIGCSDCYKTRMGTRESLAPELVRAGTRLKLYHHPLLGYLVPPIESRVVEQARDAVRWMIGDPRGRQVYDVILSGGEPLLMSNETIKAVLDEFRVARNLRVLRVCTGTLFMGLPFRIDDALLDILGDFSEGTGVRVTIQAHLGNYHMITPEAMMAVRKIRQHGLSIYSQIPIKNGVNFFLDDIDRTMESVIELGRRQLITAVEPYMFVVDMHPSTNAYYVPIEPLMQVWGALVESHDYPGLERPRTLSVLFEGGNIILSGHALFSAEKEVDRANDRVIYTLPRIAPGKEWKATVAESFVYDEPLMPGVNDDPRSLDDLRRGWFAKA
jgi:L-lysine 2,3-aminomutase